MTSRWLARPRTASYLGVILAAGCARAPAVAPGAFAPASREALAQVERSAGPTGREVTRFSWRVDNGQYQISGQGAARTAAPDSLRVDFAAALGLGRATVIVTGDAMVARPERLVAQLVPDRFALWAMLGFLRAPAGAEGVERAVDGGRTRWRVTDARGRVTVFELADGRLSAVTREEAGRTTSQLALEREPATGLVRRVRLTDFGRSTRLEVEFTGRERDASFPPETWRLGP